jgi:hypothetical protein
MEWAGYVLVVAVGFALGFAAGWAKCYRRLVRRVTSVDPGSSTVTIATGWDCQIGPGDKLVFADRSR